MFLKYEIFIALRQYKCKKNQSSDKLESIRDVFETWNQYSQNGYVVGSRTTVGEQLVAFKRMLPILAILSSKEKNTG